MSLPCKRLFTASVFVHVYSWPSFVFIMVIGFVKHCQLQPNTVNSNKLDLWKEKLHIRSVYSCDLHFQYLNSGNVTLDIVIFMSTCCCCLWKLTGSYQGDLSYKILFLLCHAMNIVYKIHKHNYHKKRNAKWVFLNPVSDSKWLWYMYMSQIWERTKILFFTSNLQW